MALGFGLEPMYIHLQNASLGGFGMYLGSNGEYFELMHAGVVDKSPGGGFGARVCPYL
jgi:hypothetical protein